jgi:hypothetical protein
MASLKTLTVFNIVLMLKPLVLFLIKSGFRKSVLLIFLGFFVHLGAMEGYNGRFEQNTLCKLLIIRPTWRNWQTR